MSDSLNIGKLELHYYFFNEKIHSMDAFDRNKCEYHLLKVFEEIAKTFDSGIIINSECLQEGGLRELYTFLSKKASPIVLTILLSVIANLITQKFTEDKELKSLRKEDLAYSIEERKLNIAKLKRELGIEENIEIESLIDTATKLFEEDIIIKRHKSNYYRVLQSNKTVSQYSITPIDYNNLPISEPFTVKSSDFFQYISKTDDLPTLIDEEALIEIISPVLKKENYSWKGIYNGEVITFKVNDTKFKQDVIDKKITFLNGFTIKCVLNTKRSFNQNDNIEKKYYALVVKEYYSDNNLIKTLQGKKYDEKNFAETKMQGKLF